MYTLGSFERRLVHGDQERDVRLETGTATWLSAQDHHGENIGTTETHVLFVELKEPAPDGTARRARHRDRPRARQTRSVPSSPGNEARQCRPLLVCFHKRHLSRAGATITACLGTAACALTRRSVTEGGGRQNCCQCQGPSAWWAPRASISPAFRGTRFSGRAGASD